MALRQKAGLENADMKIAGSSNTGEKCRNTKLQ